MNPRRKGNRRHPEQIRRLQTIRWKLTVITFLIMLLSCLITVAIYYTLIKLLGATPVVIAITVNPLFAAVILLCACGIIATILFAWLSRYYLRPIKKLIRATKEMRNGNFSVRIQADTHPLSEMSDLIQSFNEMAHELEGIELFRNDFINSFSHELKTPIVSIRGFAKELQIEGRIEEQRREYARIIEEESDRLVRLSSNVLELSRLENQQIVTNQTVFYLDEQIRQSILLLEPEWTAKSLELLPDLCELRYYANEDMLSLIWKNLLSNAIKFTPAGGRIRVEMKLLDNCVEVSVTDSGIGMPDEIRAHIFEKFYQGDSSHSKKGYGIGLAVVQRVLKLCGGTVEVYSSPGEGSCFRVLLPINELPRT